MAEGEDRTILVVGRTGAGKSEFVKRVVTEGATDVQDTPEVSSGVSSSTEHSKTYPVPGLIDSAKYHLVDTRGWMDVSDKDKGALEQLADLIQNTDNIVGVVYLLPGRMEKSEVELFDFLFSSFFQHVPPSKLLVVKSKCNSWESFNVAAEKEQLRREGKVPSIMLVAEWVAVDFHPKNTAQENSQMVEKLREQFSTWRGRLTVQATYKEYITKIHAARLELAALAGCKRDLELLNELLDGPFAERKENQEEIKRLQTRIKGNQYHEEAKCVEDIVAKINEEHQKVMNEMMERMQISFASKKGLFCTIM
ncbi:hypothetical protein BSKO_13417 [Bryopsis sp. KO-2023]|nr:hypothetical protein BSKO_13417 [Bryopsis sp. KO-2023]